MTAKAGGLSKRLDVGLAKHWLSADGQITQLLREVGLTGEEHSQALYTFPKDSANVHQTVDEIRVATVNDGMWFYITLKHDDENRVIAWPVADHTPRKKLVLALYVEVHSRLVSWWLTNAWRSDQLARATWRLGDCGQIVPAAACARSLLETAAALWVESRKLGEIWRSVKIQTAEDGPKFAHLRDLNMQIWSMMWGGKFDNRVPDWAVWSELLPRANVLGLIDKLGRATSELVQRDYQLLCNVVHPSVGNMLAFAAPMMAHPTKTVAFQYVAPFGLHFEKDGQKHAETTIEEALARSAVLAVAVLRETLDVTLRIVDDVALTTEAPTMASFRYWRMVTQKSRNVPCPCRSGKKAKNCRHAWTEPPPQIAERFKVADII